MDGELLSAMETYWTYQENNKVGNQLVHPYLTSARLSGLTAVQEMKNQLRPSLSHG
jgi:hypothetical protein